MFAGAGKKPIATKQQKAVREETQGNQLPKQLSSDSLPVRQQHVKWVEIIYYMLYTVIYGIQQPGSTCRSEPSE